MSKTDHSKTRVTEDDVRRHVPTSVRRNEKRIVNALRGKHIEDILEMTEGEDIDDQDLALASPEWTRDIEAELEAIDCLEEHNMTLEEYNNANVHISE